MQTLITKTTTQMKGSCKLFLEVKSGATELTDWKSELPGKLNSVYAGVRGGSQQSGVKTNGKISGNT